MSWAQIKIKFLSNLFFCLEVTGWQNPVLLLSLKHLCIVAMVQWFSSALVQRFNGAVLQWCCGAMLQWCCGALVQWW